MQLFWILKDLLKFCQMTSRYTKKHDFFRRFSRRRFLRKRSQPKEFTFRTNFWVLHLQVQPALLIPECLMKNIYSTYRHAGCVVSRCGQEITEPLQKPLHLLSPKTTPILPWQGSRSVLREESAPLTMLSPSLYSPTTNNSRLMGVIHYFTQMN